MNAAVLGGLVEQWVWRCELVATEYQLRPATDLKSEVDKRPKRKRGGSTL